MAFQADTLSVKRDDMLLRIDPSAQFGYHLVIDFDSTFDDQDFAVSARANARRG